MPMTHRFSPPLQVKFKLFSSLLSAMQYQGKLRMLETQFLIIPLQFSLLSLHDICTLNFETFHLHLFKMMPLRRTWSLIHFTPSDCTASLSPGYKTETVCLLLQGAFLQPLLSLPWFWASKLMSFLPVSPLINSLLHFFNQVFLCHLL